MDPFGFGIFARWSSSGRAKIKAPGGTAKSNSELSWLRARLANKELRRLGFIDKVAQRPPLLGIFLACRMFSGFVLSRLTLKPKPSDVGILQVYRYMNRGLYERDKMLFKLLVTLKIMLVASQSFGNRGFNFRV